MTFIYRDIIKNILVNQSFGKFLCTKLNILTYHHIEEDKPLSYLSWEAWPFVTFDGGHFAHVHKYNYCLGRKFHCFSMPRRLLSCTWDHELVPEKKNSMTHIFINKRA